MVTSLVRPPVYAVPQVPHLFYGIVRIDGSPASGGLTLEARINGVNYAKSVLGTTTTASDGTYGQVDDFQVLGDDLDTPSVKEGGLNGDVIEFYVQGLKATTLVDGVQVAVVQYESGSVTQLDLAISGAALTPTPIPPATPTPTPIPPATPTPTPIPPATPTPIPPATPTPIPPATPTPIPSATPTPIPSATPTPIPSATPTPIPSATPTPIPPATPTPSPTDIPTPTPTLSPTPVPPITDVIEESTPEEAVTVLEQVTLEEAAQALEGIASNIAAQIIEEMNPDMAAQIIEQVAPDPAAQMLEETPTQKAASVIELVATTKAAAIVEQMTTTKAADIIEMVGILKASDILASVTPIVAGAILEAVPTAKVIQVIRIMSVDKLEERLPEMAPGKLFEIPVQLLFDRLPTVPTEQLTFEVTPTPHPGLPPPEAVQVTPTLAVYQVPETMAQQWATLVDSQMFVERLLAKFAHDLKDVEIRLEDVQEKPADVPGLPTGQVVANFLRITANNATPEDMITAHITFFVEKSWLRSHGLHKWSLLLQRFDEGMGWWVAFPTKRVSETENRIFYTAAIPGFSLFAITGSTDLPGPRFQVSELNIEPERVDLGQKVTITARVNNITTSDDTLPISLWIDGQIEESRVVTIPANGSETVSFEALSPVGLHEARIDRLMESFQVVLAPLMGDINEDRLVDLRDLSILARFFGQGAPPGGLGADINGDEVVDLRDLAILARNIRPVAVVPGDANADGLVDLRDLAILARSFGRAAGTPEYEPEADFNRDGIVNLRDLAMLAANFTR